MDLKSMTVAELDARKAAIATESEAEGADVDALLEEVRAINSELEERKAAASKQAELRAAVAAGAGVVISETPKEENKMTFEEIRKSHEYNEAYANYIKSQFRGNPDDSECRSILSTNSNVAANPGQVPVPTYVEGRIATAWERVGLLDLVRKVSVKGNYIASFELSASAAVIHAEGTDAPDEEVLTLGKVTLVPQSIKKWIRISDEVLDLAGEEFLDYIYDEIAYQIAKFAQAQLIAAIVAAPATSSATAAGVPVVATTPEDLAAVAKGYAALSDEATDITVVMNRATHADFIAAMAANNYMFDPFAGYRVRYDNTLPAFSAATAGQTWMIVGDFERGALMNTPNGDEIKLKYDDLTESEADLVKVVGRMFAAIGVVAPNAFAKVTKPQG